METALSSHYPMVRYVPSPSSNHCYKTLLPTAWDHGEWTLVDLPIEAGFSQVLVVVAVVGH